MLEASTALPPGLAGGSPAGRGTLLDPPLDIAAAVAVLAADAPARWRGPLLPPTAQGHQGNAHPLCGLSLREQVVIPQGLHPGYLRDLSLTLEITQGSLRASEMEVPRRMRQHPPRRGHEETASCPPHPLARPGAPPPRSARTSATPASRSTCSSTRIRGTSRRSNAATRSTTTSAPTTSRSGSGGSGGAGDHRPSRPGPAPGPRRVRQLHPARRRRRHVRPLRLPHPRHQARPGAARRLPRRPQSALGPGRRPLVTAAALAARVEALEAENTRLRELARHLTSEVELLAAQAGARPASIEPARPQLRVIQGGAS